MTEQRWIIPQSVFVGISRNPKGSAPLSQMTAAGTDSAAKGRMQTVTSNSQDQYTLPNTPQWGVTLAGSGWKDEIRVADPRGFSVNVRMDAVLQMMKECAVVNGIVQAPCVWARSAGQNVLLAVGSETHDLALLQTRLANSKVTLKNVPLGNWVTLNNGVQGVYLGKYHKLWFESSNWIRSDYGNKLQVDDTARAVIWQPTVKRRWNPAHSQCIMFLTNPIVAEHVNHDHEYTDAQAELKVNELLQDASCNVQRTTRSYYSERVVVASRKPIKMDQVSITTEPVVYADADEVNRQAHKVHWSPDGVKFWMWSGQNRLSSVSLCEWNSESLKQNQLKFVRAAHNSNTPAQRTIDANKALSDLYVFKATYKTALGNQITNLI